MDYMDAGDLRYYINRGVIFNEQQTSKIIDKQSFWFDVLWKDSAVSTKETSSIAISNQKTLLSIKRDMPESLISGLPDFGSLKIHKKPVGHQVTWRLRFCLGKIIHFALISMQLESLLTNSLLENGLTPEEIEKLLERKCQAVKQRCLPIFNVRCLLNVKILSIAYVALYLASSKSTEEKVGI